MSISKRLVDERMEKHTREELAREGLPQKKARARKKELLCPHCGKPVTLARAAVDSADKVIEESAPVRPEREPGPKQQYRYPEAFERFWAMYPARYGKKVGKRTTYGKWAKLAESDRKGLLRAVRNYSQSKVVRVDGLPKDPQRFLSGAYWLDWLDGPGEDVHIEERDRRPNPPPEDPAYGPPADPREVCAELGYGSILEASRGLPGGDEESGTGDEPQKEGGGETKPANS